MKRFSILFALIVAIGLTGCDSGPSELDKRAEWFAGQAFDEASAKRAIEGYFYVDNFRLDSITLTPPGTFTVRFDVGPIVEDRMMLLRAAAAGYAYSRILFANKETMKVVLHQSGTRAIRENPEPIQAITMEMIRELADRINWQEMERAIAMDKEFEPALELFVLKDIHPAFENDLSPKLYLHAQQGAGNPANVRPQ